MIHTDPDYVFIIAEAGVNHNGRKQLAFSLIDAAAEAGADHRRWKYRIPPGQNGPVALREEVTITAPVAAAGWRFVQLA